MEDLLIRFAIGGLVVSAFAAIGDIFSPKSFAGLFGAAPSIALATLGLAVAHQGRAYAATAARSMILGAAAFLLYAAAVSWALMRYKRAALKTTLALLPVWFVSAFGLWLVLLRGRS
ncbi:MAG: DUF3147 family protein [Acidobacteriaceae bacterium]